MRGTFSRRHELDGDLEVIPIPGHTDGSTAYLWDSGDHRVLFSADTVYLDDGEWVAAVLESSDRAAYLESLELIRELDFDVLAPWAATAGEAPIAMVGRDEARRRDGGGHRAGARRARTRSASDLCLRPPRPPPAMPAWTAAPRPTRA